MSAGPDTEHRSVTPAPNGGWLRRLMPFLAAHKGKVAASFFAALAGSVVASVAPLIQLGAIDKGIIGGSLSKLTPYLIGMVVIGVLSFAFGYMRRMVAGRVAYDIEFDLRNAIYDHLQRMDFARHDDLQTGQLVSRSISDVRMLQSILSYLPLMTGTVLMFFVSLALMLKLSPLLTVVALFVVPAVFVVALRMRPKVYPSTWHAQERLGELATVVDEAVSGVRVVKGFGQERRELARLVESAGDVFGSRMRNVRMMARYQPAMQALPGIGQVGVIAVGGWLAIHGHMTVGTLVAFSSYLIQLLTPVRMLTMMLGAGQMARASAERILQVLDATPFVHDAPGARRLEQVRGDVELTDVVFGYLPTEPVLKGFSLRVGAGETVALVGTSGSGKSTISMLLPRFYDRQGGTIRIDGHDVADVTLESLRRRIGVVFEEAFLFSDSIRANIAYGRPDATDADVVAAARAAEAHEFITALPQGYDTVVGERGLTLSGGQRQRVALARALITDPKILILDDATSAIDSATEEQIHRTLRRLMEGRTTIIIAHRRSTLDLADRIVVLDDGVKVDSGTHQELMDRCSLYRTLLSGPGDDAEGTGSEEAFSGVTESAWRVPDAQTAAAISRPAAGGDHGWRSFGFTPTPEFLEKVEKLPPIVDTPKVDVAHETAPDPDFKLKRFVRPYVKPLLAGLGLVALDAMVTLVQPLFFGRGVDLGLVAKAQAALWKVSGLMLLMVAADFALTYAITRYTGRTAERLLYALRVRIFAHLQRLSMDYYDREMGGRIMTRMTSDVEAMSSLLQNGLINALVQLITFAGVAGIMFWMNPRLAAITMLIAPFMALATFWFRRASSKAYTKVRERVAVVNANLQESLSGVRVAQAYVREDRNSRDFRRVAGEYLGARLEGQRLQSLFFPFMEFFQRVAGTLVLGAGAWFFWRGTLSIGQLTSYLLLLGLFFGPIQQLSQVFDTYQQAAVAMRKIRELLSTQSKTPEAADPVVPRQIYGQIRFEDVHFSYEGAAQEALSGVNFVVKPGETVALVGETGAGKSTIVKLVARFYDATAGRVLIDDIPVTSMDLHAYRSRLGYVPQDAFLFGGTIRDNIAYGRPDATDAEVEEAARAVGAHDFIAGLAYGYLQPVTERGRSLSAGQRQLIALARAKLVEPSILILDEATSNLDLSTEARVARAMGLVSEGRTTLIIAHRLQTARRADRILVVDHGRITEEGTHDELVAAGGGYARMWESFEVTVA